MFSGIEAQTWATHKLARNNYNNKAWNGTAPVQEYAWLKMASNSPRRTSQKRLPQNVAPPNLFAESN
ncbi:MAG TPA: hypothetical protein VL349_12890, partial [Terriglobales bacterium]|nr:hypothetical protein [Terriglobales bacterium]